MGRVYLEYKNSKWNRVEHSDFWITEAILQKLDNLKMIQKKNWDGVIIIDGKERSGKSILGMIFGWYLSNGKLTINNFASGLGDAARKIDKLPDGSVLIVDEGSTVFSSKDSTSGAQKKLVKLMDVIGQKNMIFIICLPCFFDLNKTIAVRRSLFLCHVYPDAAYNRGQFVFWGENKKKILYKFGKQNYDSYAYPSSDLIGNYFDFKPPFIDEYLDKIKKDSLAEVMADAMGEGVSADQEVRNTEALIYGYLKTKLNIAVKDIAKIKGQSERTVRERIVKYNDEIESNA